MSAPARETGDAGCGSGIEVFALQVLGHSMAPEFVDGDVIVIEPAGALDDGAYVLARHADEWIFRQLCRRGQGWLLRALAPGHPELPLADLSSVHGRIIQKAVPGRRRLSKRYV